MKIKSKGLRVKWWNTKKSTRTGDSNPCCCCERGLIGKLKNKTGANYWRTSFRQSSDELTVIAGRGTLEVISLPQQTSSLKFSTIRRENPFKLSFADCLKPGKAKRD